MSDEVPGFARDVKVVVEFNARAEIEIENVGSPVDPPSWQLEVPQIPEGVVHLCFLPGFLTDVQERNGGQGWENPVLSPIFDLASADFDYAWEQ